MDVPPPVTDSSDNAIEGQESKPAKQAKQKASPKSKAGAKKVTKKPTSAGTPTETEHLVGEGSAPNPEISHVEEAEDDVEGEPPAAEQPEVMGEWEPAAAAGSEVREKLLQGEAAPDEREAAAEMKRKMMKKMADDEDVP
ncbi:unnamed protein product, partial [Symbiodinium sp. CCMP2456]